MREQLQPLLGPAVAREKRALRLTLFVLSLGLFMSTFVLVFGGMWSGAPASQAEAEEQAAQNTYAIPRVVNQGLSDRAALLYLSLSAALQPTPTATPETIQPTPTSLPEAQPTNLPPPGSPARPPAVVEVIAEAPPPRSCLSQGTSGYALDLFHAVNNARAEYGMPALAADGCVAYVAQLRSNDMATRGYFAHVSPDGSSAFSLLDAYGVPSGWAGENLARNNYPPGETVAVAIRDLMASPPHRENILSPNYTAMGVAMALDSTGIYYYTMVFVGPA